MFLTEPYRPIMYGIVLPGPNVAEGVPIVKGGDVAAKRLTPELLNRTTVEIEGHFVRARLCPGDLLFAIRGSIGDVEGVPEALTGANITQDVARVSTATGVSPKWLRFVLQSKSVQGLVAARVTGATVRGLNIWDLKRIEVPLRNSDRQKADLMTLTPAEQRLERLLSALTTQTALLAEHRQALITAAVTSEMAVPGVAA